MEGGEIYKGETVNDDDKTAADNGILDILDIDEGKQYYDGSWHEIETWEKEA